MDGDLSVDRVVCLLIVVGVYVMSGTGRIDPPGPGGWRGGSVLVMHGCSRMALRLRRRRGLGREGGLARSTKDQPYALPSWCCMIDRPDFGAGDFLLLRFSDSKTSQEYV